MGEIDSITIRTELEKIHGCLMTAVEAYKEACRNHASYKVKYMKLLAQRIATYKSFKKNIGMEMCILTAMTDPDFEQRDEFIDTFDKYEYWKKIEPSFALEAEAWKGRSIFLQSLMRYDREGERFG